jgi:hypothetical protein
MYLAAPKSVSKKAGRTGAGILLDPNSTRPVQIRSKAGCEVNVVRQLVGLSCVMCRQTVESISEGRFCPDCGSPIHRECINPPQALEDDGTCPGCGATEQQVAAAPVREVPVPPRQSVSTREPDAGTANALYQQVPWHRRSENMTLLVLAGFFCAPPLLWWACFICLTGEVYYNRVKKDGTLARWPHSNKIAAVIVLILQALAVAARLWLLLAQG